MQSQYLQDTICTLLQGIKMSFTFWFLCTYKTHLRYLPSTQHYPLTCGLQTLSLLQDFPYGIPWLGKCRGKNVLWHDHCLSRKLDLGQNSLLAANPPWKLSNGSWCSCWHKAAPLPTSCYVLVPGQVVVLIWSLMSSRIHVLVLVTVYPFSLYNFLVPAKCVGIHFVL